MTEREGCLAVCDDQRCSGSLALTCNRRELQRRLLLGVVHRPRALAARAAEGRCGRKGGREGDEDEEAGKAAGSETEDDRVDVDDDAGSRRRCSDPPLYSEDEEEEEDCCRSS